MLDRQIVPLQLVSGVDTKTDDKQTAKLLTLENGTFLTPKKIRKRNGYAQLPVAKLGGGSLTSADAGLVYNNELITLSGNKLYSFAEQQSAQQSKGPVYSFTAQNQAVLKNNNTQLTPDMALVNGLEVYAFTQVTPNQNGDPSVGLKILDSNTGTNYTLQSPVSGILGKGYNTRVLSIGTNAYILYVGLPFSGGFSSLKCAVVDTTNPAGDIVSSTNLATNMSNVALIPSGYPAYNLYFDAVVYNGNIYVSYFDSATSISVKIFGPSLNLISQNSFTIGSRIFLSGITLAINTNNDIRGGEVWIFWASEDTNGRVDAIAISADLSTTVTTFNVVTNSHHPSNITAGQVNSGTIQCFSEFANVLPDANEEIFRFIESSAINIGNHTLFQTNLYQRSCGIASRIFNPGGVINDVLVVSPASYIMVVYDSSLQATYFMMLASTPGNAASSAVTANDGSSIGRFLSQQAGGFNRYVDNSSVDQLLLSTVSGVTIVSNKVIFPSLIKTQAISSNGVISYLIGLTKETLNLIDPINNFQSTQLDADVLFTGSEPTVYDGTNVIEAGFNLFPEPYSAQDFASGSLGAGTYEYFFTYEWKDNNGQIWRSVPSPGLSVTIAANREIRVQSIFLNFTRKQGVQICVYRTTANGTVAHKLTNIAGQNPFLNSINDATSVQWNYFDNTPDAQIVNNETLYTTGNVLENDPPPACSFSTPFDNRVFLGGLENPYQMAYSQNHLSGETVNFSADFLIQVPTNRGVPTAAKAMDDKLIVFTKTGIFYMYGTGPDDTGQGNQYSTLQEIVSAAGCAYPKSIVAYQDGLIFKTEKGIWRLSRALQVDYIGADVEGFNSLNITSAVLLQNKNQIRFMTDGWLSFNSIELVYDYFMGQWSIFTNHSGYAATIYLGNYLFWDQNGVPTYETEGVFVDPGTTAIIMKIGFQWVNLMTFQGYQRARRMQLLGNRKSAHTLNVQIFHDYSAIADQTDSWQPAAGALDQWLIHLQTQKCEALRAVIFDSFTGTPGEGYDLSGLAFEIGVKRGLNKLPAAQSVG